ncbi:MAG: M28 family metallopeptidase [Candidatus Bipolaricaulota bacterium]
MTILTENELKKLTGEVWMSDESRENLTYLTDELKNRFAGTKGEHAAADYVETKFREYGLEEVKSEEFDFQGWQRGSTSLSVLGEDLPAIALPYCPPGTIEGELIDLGDGLEEDFDRDIKDKIVMVTSHTPTYRKRWLHRGEKYSRTVDDGARGFVFINHYPGNLPPTGSLRSDRIGEITGIGVSKEVGSRMKRNLQRKGELKATIKVDAGVEKSISHNVIGKLNPNSDRPAILVGGHLDGHDISQGAEDNGAGITTVIEMARALAPYSDEIERPIYFVAFGAEELGLIGSKKYVERHRVSDIGLVLNCDGPGRARDVKFITNGFRDLAGKIEEYIPEDESPPKIEDRISAHSDHWPFVKEGIPACQISPDTGDEGRGWGHTSADTLDKVDFRNIKQNAITLAQLLLEFSSEGLGVKKKDPEEIKQQIKEEGREEEIDWL